MKKNGGGGGGILTTIEVFLRNPKQMGQHTSDRRRIASIEVIAVFDVVRGSGLPSVSYIVSPGTLAMW